MGKFNSGEKAAMYRGCGFKEEVCGAPMRLLVLESSLLGVYCPDKQYKGRGTERYRTCADIQRTAGSREFIQGIEITQYGIRNLFEESRKDQGIKHAAVTVASDTGNNTVPDA